jgi:hypothetical protein
MPIKLATNVEISPHATKTEESMTPVGGVKIPIIKSDKPTKATTIASKN